MNALWLDRLYRYKNTDLAHRTACNVIAHKVAMQGHVMHAFHCDYQVPIFSSPRDAQGLFLLEARSARTYWRCMRSIVPSWTDFPGRKQRGQDVVNRLLDIGYHHLARIVKKKCAFHEISAAVGLLHVARRADSAPLVYDVMELFRADLIDCEVIRFVRLKKRPLTELSQKDIAQFLARVNKRRSRKYYIAHFRQCHTYEYYMDLQILRLVAAVNHRRAFQPIVLPRRHESRC